MYKLQVINGVKSERYRDDRFWCISGEPAVPERFIEVGPLYNPSSIYPQLVSGWAIQSSSLVSPRTEPGTGRKYYRWNIEYNVTGSSSNSYGTAYPGIYTRMGPYGAVWGRSLEYHIENQGYSSDVLFWIRKMIEAASEYFKSIVDLEQMIAEGRREYKSAYYRLYLDGSIVKE